MKIGICQIDIIWECKEENKAKISSLIARNKNAARADWLIFPEFTLSGFSLDKKKTSLTKGDIDFFKDISITHSVNLSFGGILDGRNKLITLDRKGDIVSAYSKIHLFSCGGEDGVYAPGRMIEKFLLCGFRITPFICYDLRFPYLFWPKAPGTDIYAVAANWPSARRDHWESLLKARAIENQAYIIGVNRIGKDLRLNYTGDSLVVDPSGKVILDCHNKEGIFVAEINKACIAKIRRDLPFIKDRKRMKF